jgi:hypothetical protein
MGALFFIMMRKGAVGAAEFSNKTRPSQQSPLDYFVLVSPLASFGGTCEK